MDGTKRGAEGFDGDFLEQQLAEELGLEPEGTDVEDDASYICGACGEEIVVPIDASGGPLQDYVEDCPVCCHPNHLIVQIEPDGEVSVRSELE